MRRLLLISVILIVGMLLFGGCSSSKSKETITTNVTGTQPPQTVIKTVIQTPTMSIIPASPTTTALSPTIVTPPTTAPLSTTMPPPTLTTTSPVTTTTPLATTAVGLSGFALMGGIYGLDIMDESGGFIHNEEFPSVLDFIVDEKGEVWVACDEGLKIFDGQDWRDYEVPKGVYPEHVFVDSEGRVCVGYYEGVSVLEGGQWTSYSSDLFGLSGYASFVNDVAIDHQGQIWVCTDVGVTVFNGDS